jgi:hypothetical protein
MKLAHVMEFERMLKDPENINPPFQPNVTSASLMKK